MFKIEAFRDWLKEQGADYRYSTNRTVPDGPYDRALITLTEIPGPASFTTEEAFDTPLVQIRSRGSRDLPQEARDISHQIDALILDRSRRPFSLAGYHVLTLSRLGGSPAYLGTDDQNRTTYVCNYWLEIER